MRPFNLPSVSLAKIAEFCNSQSSTSNEVLAEIVITGATHSDSEVMPGDLFVAIPGAKRHGAEFYELLGSAVYTICGKRAISTFFKSFVRYGRRWQRFNSVFCFSNRTYFKFSHHCRRWNLRLNTVRTIRTKLWEHRSHSAEAKTTPHRVRV